MPHKLQNQRNTFLIERRCTIFRSIKFSSKPSFNVFNVKQIFSISCLLPGGSIFFAFHFNHFFLDFIEIFCFSFSENSTMLFSFDFDAKNSMMKWSGRNVFHFELEEGNVRSFVWWKLNFYDVESSGSVDRYSFPC